ncbi:hypothetical protein FHS00_000474 [Limimaricola variabilis]|uniref:Uncharacterized protein n=1 Tax=Limimaricola variabilis TaxID=1492771 RepID=A0ABR6HKG4_9RHOB|nr:hypothetical protein [Limimaricola variabilis]
MFGIMFRIIRHNRRSPSCNAHLRRDIGLPEDLHEDFEWRYPLLLR